MAEFVSPQHEPDQVGGDSRFRTRADFDKAFSALVRGLEDEGVGEEVEEENLGLDFVLDVIDRYGVRGAAEITATQMADLGPHYQPAEQSNVIEYLSNVRTWPRIIIKDVGSVDADWINQLRLSKEHYVDELQDLLTYIEADTNEVSVVDFPDIFASKKEADIHNLEKRYVYEMLDQHGILLPVMDEDDPKAWHDLKRLVETLADSNFRNDSLHLREGREAGRWMPVRDVIDTIEDKRRIRREAFAIALDNRTVPVSERRRLLEGLPRYMKPLVKRFLEDLEASEGEGADTDIVGDIFNETS